MREDLKIFHFSESYGKQESGGFNFVLPYSYFKNLFLNNPQYKSLWQLINPNVFFMEKQLL